MRRRLITAMLAVCTLAVIGFALPLAAQVRARYLAEEVLRVQRIATAASRDVAVPLASAPDPADIAPVPGTKLAVYDPAGRLVAGDGPITADSVVQRSLANVLAEWTGARRLVVAIPIVVGEQVGAVIRAERSLHDVNQRIWRAWGLMALLGFAVIALAAIVAAALSRRLCRPIDGIAAAAVRLGQGDFTSLVADSGVAELDAAGHALNDTSRRLENILVRERNFSSDVSHQMRTPITAIRLGIETELLAPRSDPKQVLNELLVEVDHLQQTVIQLLSFSRGDANRQRIATSDLLTTCGERWASRLEVHGRRLMIDSRTDALVDVSLGAVVQALDVLIDNATVHGVGDVTIAAALADGAILITVADEGPGLQRTDDDLFERKPSPPLGSQRSGIGLPLARALIEAEGGRLFFKSRTPIAQFAVLLPTANPPNSP